MSKYKSKEWEWKQVEIKTDAAFDEKVLNNIMNAKGLTRSQAQEELDRYKSEPKKRYLNYYYKVTMVDHPWGEGMLRDLSVTHRDGGTGRDWRDYQQIKNDLIGKECEAVELYPADSRLVDSADSFHLWGIADEEFRFPLGFGDRLVTDCEREVGTQRKL